jgi:D-alanyl-D-alanine dipeptidase
MSRAALVVTLLLAGSAAAAGPIPDDARQLLVVTARDWNARGGSLRRYTRDPGGRWVAAGGAIPVSFGAKGLAWGRGLAPEDPAAPPAPGPAKKEGDARTPAGAFRLGDATGTDAAPPRGTRVAWRPAGDLVCVDDPASSAYNRVVPGGGDWSSFERMDMAVIYRHTLFVDHNPAQVPGGGSCIFLHVWRTPRAATLGCTAMDRAAMEAILGWLDPAARPILVVLPDGAYAALRAAWALP